MSLPYGDRVLLYAGEHVYGGSGALDPWRADEDAMDSPDVGDPEVPREGVDLRAEGVATHGDVKTADQLLVAPAQATNWLLEYSW